MGHRVLDDITLFLVEIHDILRFEDHYDFLCLSFCIYLHQFPRISQLPQTSRLKKNQKFIISDFLRTEVWNQDVGCATLPLKALGEKESFLFLPAAGDSWYSLFMAAWLESCSSSASIFIWHPSICLYVSNLSLLCLMRTSDIGFRVHSKYKIILSQELDRIMSVKTLFSSRVTFTGMNGQDLDPSSRNTVETITTSNVYKHIR